MSDHAPAGEPTVPTETAPPGPAAPKRKAALGTWAIVLGSIGILFAFIPHAATFAIVLAALALLLGGIGLLRKGGRAVTGTVFGGVALVLGIIFLNVYSSGATDAAAAAPSSQASASAASAASPAVPATPVAPAKPAAPTGTVSELQALAAAKGYLADGQGFSQAGLLAQLTSSYGNGFAQADAQWAVDNSGADWNAQALRAAKNYLTDGQGFSEASLTQQLTSSSGGQFTPDQAAYAIANAGADWNAQAVDAAKGYVSSGMGFSRASLIQQLTSSYGNGFTEAQAEYAAGQVGLQ